MKEGIACACVYVVVWIPRYLSRPNCLRKLQRVLDSCDRWPHKQLLLLPVHEGVSFDARKGMIACNGEGVMLDSRDGGTALRKYNLSGRCVQIGRAHV